jgi:hypothetical protein
MRRTSIAAVLLLLCTIGCVSAPVKPNPLAPTRPPRSAEATVAIYGDHVVQSANLALTGLDGLMSTMPPIVPREVGIVIIRAIDVVAHDAVKLADALQIIDSGKDAAARGDAISLARSLVDGMLTAINGSLVPLTDPDMRARVVGVLGVLKATLSTLALVLPSGPNIELRTSTARG